MQNCHLYIASCTQAGGIYHYKLQNGTILACEFTPCDRPMYAAIAKDKLHVLLRQPISGCDESAMITYRIASNGALLSPSAMVKTHGKVACHLCCFQDEVYAVNYLSGNVVCSSGKINAHSGHGPDPIRQDMPHTHYIFPSADWSHLLVTDLGTDAVYQYDRDLRVLHVAHVPHGHGARHLAYSEDGSAVFCCNELRSTVTVFTYRSGKLTALQTVPVLDHEAKSAAAAIRVQGQYVYVSNRGDDSISCLQWDGCQLQLCSITPCGGKSPRDILILDDLLLCANENSDSVTVFTMDGSKINRANTQIEIKKPLCITAYPMLEE